MKEEVRMKKEEKGLRLLAISQWEARNTTKFEKPGGCKLHVC